MQRRKRVLVSPLGAFYRTRVVYNTPRAFPLWNFASCATHAVSDKKTILEDIGLLLGVRKLTDWYSVSTKRFLKRGGGELLSTVSKSSGEEKVTDSPLFHVLREIYPDHPWNPSQFVVPSPKQNYWSEPNHAREFFDSIGEPLGIKQLSDWYKITKRQVTEEGGWSLLKYHKHLEDALKAAYPDFAWDSSRFIENRAPFRHWHNPENIAEALKRAAAKLNLVKPEDWYSVRMRSLFGAGFPPTVKRAGLIELLKKMYPDHEWKCEKLFPVKTRKTTSESRRPYSLTVKKGFWGTLENRRQFLLWFAQKKGFDPLQPENWGEISAADIIEHKGRTLLLRYGSVVKALQDCFPELDFSGVKWEHGHWAKNENCRNFFNKYAADKGFDPSIPENWLKVSKAQVLGHQGRGPLNRYGSLKQALIATYPELNFDFKERAKDNYWSDLKNCRTFFDEFAKSKGFDPLVVDNWYSANISNLLDRQGAHTIQKNFNGFRMALQAAYPELNFLKWRLAAYPGNKLKKQLVR